MSVPRDMSVFGFDDLSFAQETWLPLTTDHLPFEKLGRAAARLVLPRRLLAPAATPRCSGPTW